MLKKVARAGSIAAVSCLASVAAPVSASETTPEEACLFFFHMEGPQLQPTRDILRLRNMQLGEATYTPSDLPRYANVSWPDAIVEEVFVRGHDGAVTGGGARAFELQCLVDLTDRRVLSISIGPGQRVGELLEIEGLKESSVTPATGHRQASINLQNTLMRGLY